MSRGVDVLALMEGAAAYLSTSGWTPSPSMEAEFAEARAAVAELIEATQRLHDRAEFECFGRDASVEIDAVSAALARVRGAV